MVSLGARSPSGGIVPGKGVRDYSLPVRGLEKC